MFDRNYTSRGRNNSRGANPDRRTIQNYSRVLETLPRPAYYVGQTAAAAFFSFVSSALTACRLLRCIWHERGQSINTNRTGFRHRHTQRGILTYHHGWQSSAQRPSVDATRGGGSTIVVLFCMLHSALPTGCRRGSRQTEVFASGHAKGEGRQV